MSSPLSKRVNEQITEQEINEDIQQLRVERGISRSPGQDYETEEDELNTIKRRNENKMHADNTIELTGNLDTLISEAIDTVVINHSENIADLGIIFPRKPFTTNVINVIRDKAKSNTFTFMFDIMPILLKDNDTNDIIDKKYILSLTDNIFIFSLYDIVDGYQDPTIMEDPKYKKIIGSKVLHRINELQEEELIIPTKMLLLLFVIRINALIEKNIKDGIYINNTGNRKSIKFTTRGGKTKKRRYMRNSKKGLRIKVKKQWTKRRRIRKKI